MNSIFKPALLTALLVTASVAAFSQAPGARDCTGPMGGGGPGYMMGDGPMAYGPAGHGRAGQRDPARIQARMEKRAARLKAELKLTPAQEGAWTAFTAAMTPTADLREKHFAARAELENLTTPQRIDKMTALRSERMGQLTALMNQRGEAVKTFYAALTPEQQQVFDTNAQPRHGHAGWRTGQRDNAAPAQPKQ